MMMNKGFLNKNTFLAFFLVFSLWVVIPCHAVGDKIGPKRLPINYPDQITAEVDPILSGAVSDDGKWLAYVSKRQKMTDLWLRSADPSTFAWPKRLTFDPSTENSPSFSADGRFIAFTGTQNDVKGDIYLIDITSQKTKPLRLTNRDTEDGNPCFSPDGKTIYFQQKIPGKTVWRISALPVQPPDPSIRADQIIDNGASPSISPDGNTIAFLSHRNDASGNIFIFNLLDKKIRQLTHGKFLDFSPIWSKSGNSVLFSRISSDTNSDGRINLKDNASIWKVNINGKDDIAYPITSLVYSAVQPHVTDNRLFFLSDRAGITNYWSLPLEGQIPLKSDVEKQWELAEKISLKIPFEPFTTVLALYKILENFPDQSQFCAKAALHIGKAYQKLKMNEEARSAFQFTARTYDFVLPESKLAQIEEEIMRIKNQIKFMPDRKKRLTYLEKNLNALINSVKSHDPLITNRAKIESARLIFESKDTPIFMKAVKLLDQVSQKKSSDTEQIAEARLLKADILSWIGGADESYQLYRSIIETSPENEKWANISVGRILDIILSKSESFDLDEKAEYLRRVSKDSEKELPLLSMGALNRIGDLYFAADEWAKAKSFYREVLRKFPDLTKPSTAARLSLAEILYREERFRQALDLYETELDLRPYADRIHQLARLGYIRKSLASGEYLLGVGEIPSARKTFKELINYDPNIVEAHRGYIKCAASMGDIHPVIKVYEQKMKDRPNDPMGIYGKALCLTYLNTKKDLENAKRLLIQTIELNGQIEYFHQTLGYVFEVLETVYKTGNSMELALESYQKAYFLNDHKNNSINAAHLLLNMGNAHFLLGQFEKAFKNYSDRLETRVSFDDPGTEILFFRRLGASAFQVKENEETINAYLKAIDLINTRIDPGRIVTEFDKTSRYIMDRVVAPSLNQENTKAHAKKIARTQSDINRSLASLSEKIESPPSPKWKAFKENIENLLIKQKALNKSSISLISSLKEYDLKVEEATESLETKVIRIKSALEYPEQLIQLKAEMLDRLGLAYQEADLFEKAVETFKKVYLINDKLGFYQNLARAKRSIAHNTYMLAQTYSGEARKKLLETAAKDFSDTISLVDQYGVPDKNKEPSQGLLNLKVQTSVNAFNSTQAGHGFSPAQEKRLAKTFITRIHVELGELTLAEKSIRDQLAKYPSEKPVSEKDAHGVSILKHRAGLLSNASENYRQAFNYFKNSADISLKTKNSVSSMINVSNMARMLLKIPVGSPSINQYRLNLSTMDKKLHRLIANDPFLNDRSISAMYHNTMGVCYAGMLKEQASSTKETIHFNSYCTNALIHFQKGIDLFKNEKDLSDRHQFFLLSSLHINAAELALKLNLTEKSEQHLKKALSLSQKGLLPDITWRAYAGLNQYDKALKELSSISILRAGCRPFEILNTFEKPFADLIADKQFERAFNFLEKLSEFQRFHQMAPFVCHLDESDKKRLLQIYPKLERIQSLRLQLSTAQDEDKNFIQTQIRQEADWIDTIAGDNYSNLPDIIRRMPDIKTRETTVILLGLAVQSEATADFFVKTSNIEKKKDAAKKFDQLIKRYHEIRQKTASFDSEDPSSYTISFFGPESFELIDVMENLDEGETFLRFFKTKAPGQKDNLSMFAVNPEEIHLIQSNQFNKIIKNKVHFKDDVLYIAYENPLDLPDFNSHPRVLSASHFIRSKKSRKPFKQIILITPDMPHPLKAIDTKTYDVISLSSDTRDLRSNRLAGINTLVISSPLRLSDSVPTQPGERPRTFLNYEMDKGTRLSISDLLGQTQQLSLALLPGGMMKDAFCIGHFFSLYGCPTVIMPKDNIVIVNPSDFLYPFFETYALKSPLNSLKEALKNSNGQNDWILLGDKGMNQDEVTVLARQNFEKYVIKGRQAFENNNPVQAFFMFENAIQIARKNETFRSYLSALLGYALESAYRGNILDKAKKYATDLAHLAEEQNPDTEAHAEALLKLGLVLAKLEQFDKALPVLEESIDILASLELSTKQVAALAETGVVLENATEYDRALTFFKSAAGMSKDLNQQEFLAQQYANMGRIYDLRMSRYALAKQNYKKAMLMYKELDQPANVAQALLNIGRCERLLGNFAGADIKYKDAMALIDSNPEQILLKAKIIIEQANNEWFRGNYGEAFKLQRICDKISEKNNFSLMKIISLNTSGLIWWTLQDPTKALLELEKALAAAHDLKFRKDEIATTLNNIGLIHRETGNFDLALRSFEEALVVDKKIKSRWAIAYDMRNLGLTYLRMNQPEKAISLFQKAKIQAHDIGNRINEAKTLLGLGEAYLSIGKLNEAEHAFSSALELSESMSMQETRWRSLYGLAKIKLSNDNKKAEKLLYSAVEIIEKMRSDIKIEQLKDNFIDNKLSVYGTLCKLLADQGKINESFEIAERSRARNFIDLLGNQRLTLNRSVDQKLYDRMRGTQNRIKEYETLFAQATVPSEKNMYEKTLHGLYSDLDSIKIDIQVTNPNLTSILTVEPLKPANLMKAIDHDVALLAYYLLKDEIFCWVVRKDKMELIRTPVGKDTLGQTVLEYRRMMQNIEPLEEKSEKLFSWLVEPVLKNLKGIDKLGIIPHGQLHYLSFATLKNKDNYLIDRFALFNLPSASLLDYTIKKRDLKKNTRVLAVGNPDLGDPIYDLPFSEYEVGSIKWNFPTIAILTKEKASEKWVVENIEKFGIIHIASHGEFDPVNPLFSAIKLSKDADSDGDLKAAEVFGLKIKADLVVLSACQTGLGRINGGDDIIGLNRAFFYAGTHTIISSLWRVSDESSAILIKQFYRAYETLSKAKSLRAAILHVKNRYPHPGYWGAFTLVGDYF